MGSLLWNIFQNDSTYQTNPKLCFNADDHQIYEGDDISTVNAIFNVNTAKASHWYEVNFLKRNLLKYHTVTTVKTMGFATHSCQCSGK